VISRLLKIFVMLSSRIGRQGTYAGETGFATCV
jgi:hypothetical protein